ncbi:MAG: hypothetical protein AB7G28_00195 [Pirellulales bacterium]
MSHLSALQMTVFVFAPMVFTGALIALVNSLRAKLDNESSDGPERLLAAAIRQMPAERNEWGDAMMAELIHLHERGESFRWCFALGCIRAALFPPATTSWPRCAFDAVKRLGSSCAVLSVVLPTFALPLLWLTAAACNAFTSHDDFFNGELVPLLLGLAILGCLAIMFSGIPLGIAALVRRERHRWLARIGPALSTGLFVYMQVVQHFAASLQ